MYAFKVHASFAKGLAGDQSDFADVFLLLAVSILLLAVSILSSCKGFPLRTLRQNSKKFYIFPSYVKLL
jgi:hypothetical protein